MLAWSAQRLFAGVYPKPKLYLRNNWRRGSLRSARWGINFPKWFTIPMNRCIPATSEGTGNWVTAVVFCGSAWSPELSMMWARNRVEHRENTHSSLRVNPASCRGWRTARTRPSCSDWSTPWMRTSSIWQSVPSEPSSILDIVRWKISGAELIPNGSLLKQKRPNGETKVVSNFDSSSKGICQNPLLASSLEKILLSPTLARFSSTEGTWVYLTLDCFVKVSQVNTDTHTAIWFKDRADTCIPFS